jgi:TolA-binding protein
MGRIIRVGVALAALAAAGCTSVKMVQRDGCWVRRTEKAFGRVIEEVGPCGRAEPRWADDRFTRLLQECVAQADWRWQTRALEVWSRRLPYATPQPREDELLRACMDELRTGMQAEAEAAKLKDRIGDLSGRIAELSGERDALRGDAARDRAKLEEREDRIAEWLGKSHDKLSDWLGQAAQRPPAAPANATATASSTSDGKATTSNDSGTTLSADSAASPPQGGPPVASASVVLPGGAPAQPVAAPAPAPVPAPGPAVTPAGAPAPTATATPALPKRTKRARRPAAQARPAAPASCEPCARAAGG